MELFKPIWLWIYYCGVPKIKLLYTKVTHRKHFLFIVILASTSFYRNKNGQEQELDNQKARKHPVLYQMQASDHQEKSETPVFKTHFAAMFER